MASELRVNDDAKSQQSSRGRICHVCEEWGSPCNAVCKDCPHSYHVQCIEPRCKPKEFINCSDIGKQCDTHTPPTLFEFGEEIKEETTKQRSNNRRIRQIYSFDTEQQFCGSKNYKSFKYMNVEYKIGDDVVLSTAVGPVIGRIAKIYKFNDEHIPKVQVYRYWNATAVMFTSYMH